MIAATLTSRRLTLFITLAVLTTGTGFGGEVAALDTFAPRNMAELKEKLAQLRKQYSVYLSSFPEPSTLRSRIPINTAWVSKYEVEEARDSSRSVAPDWFREDYNDSSWEKTQVPEWRYRGKERKPVSCILWYRTTFPAKPAGNDKRTFLVFEGVDWEAEVWLNGKRLGHHKVYYEPFRFDVTSVLKKNNTLAVRVIAGPKYGEPAAYWSLFPLVPAKQQRYVRDKSKSVVGNKNDDLHIGSGYGIHREVYLETTGNALVTDILARGNVEKGNASVTAHVNSVEAVDLKLRVELMPENFKGRAYRTSKTFAPSNKEKTVSVNIPMPNAKLWTPDTPYLYRCRVTVLKGGKKVDAHDALFGYRSFSMVNERNPRKELQAGTLLLNGKPIYLRGTNVQGFNALWYWGEHDKLMDLMLMLKAANFNAVRSCQHVQYPEVRELQDRLGIMSQQDQGSRYPKLGNQTKPGVIAAAGALTRICYNNPGVIFISYANETKFDPTAMIEATLEIDPERIIKPICGGPHGGTTMPPRGRSLYELPDSLWQNVISDFHPYWGWYGWPAQPKQWCRPLPADRMSTVGEYGAEALDAYETMSSAYPSHWKPTPPKETDTLWGHVQVKKDDPKQIMGFRGKKPSNLGQYIEASQTYQSDVLTETTKSWRLSPKRIAGYFQFHYVDVMPANWPKSIVSHDLTPKEGYYAMAQINQPLVAIPRVTEHGKVMELWIANDLNESFDNYSIRWVVRDGRERLVEGEKPVGIPAHDAVRVHRADLSAVPAHIDVIRISTSLLDSDGVVVGRYEQELFLAAWRKE